MLKFAKIGGLNSKSESTMRENAAEQVTTPTRKTSRMAKKGRAPLCPQPTATTTQKKKTTAERCMKPGPLQRNPYLNFLREYRKENCGLSAVETIRRGALAWKNLTEEEKFKYIAQAFYTRNRKTGLGRRRRRKSKSPARSKRTTRKSRQAKRRGK